MFAQGALGWGPVSVPPKERMVAGVASGEVDADA